MNYRETSAEGVLRNLTADEIGRLESRGCRCSRWEDMTVGDPFDPDCYFNVTFGGKITLDGTGEGTVEPVSGIVRRCGIYNAALTDCHVGRGVYINNIQGGLCRLDIADGAMIDSVYSITCDGESRFGNDVEVNVMSETGGREVMISSAMSAPLAYLAAFYRHSATLSKAIKEICKRYTGDPAERAPIGRGARIISCGELRNIAIGEGAVIIGASRLVNGTVGCAEVGADVIAQDFIIQDGGRVDSGAHLHGVLVGHCARISAGFTAHDTLVFTNSQLENGESAAAFCGPFTTSMHKSSLLIGGLFSFYNAGSGTNQSNHLYKLGPMHQGILARGCKTGSDSYIMWPAVVGPFTTIIGHHTAHPDTSSFPFSYLVNDPAIKCGEASVLIPGAAIGSIGLSRDVEKWPARTGLQAADDPVNYNWLSPYTVGRILDALTLLRQMSADSDTPYTEHRGAAIPRRSIEKAIDRYTLLVKLFTAGVMLRKIIAVISTTPEITPDSLYQTLRTPPADTGSGRWVDLCGLLAPRQQVDRLTDTIVNTPDITLEQVNTRINDLAARYGTLSWQWLWHNLRPLTGHDATDLTPDHLRTILQDGIDAANAIQNLLIADAAKEYDYDRAGLGFGIDDTPGTPRARADFDRARGTLTTHPYLARLHRRVLTFTASLTNTLHLLTQS